MKTSGQNYILTHLFLILRILHGTTVAFSHCKLFKDISERGAAHKKPEILQVLAINSIYL